MPARRGRSVRLVHRATTWPSVCSSIRPSDFSCLKTWVQPELCCARKRISSRLFRAGTAGVLCASYRACAICESEGIALGSRRYPEPTSNRSVVVMARSSPVAIPAEPVWLIGRGRVGDAGGDGLGRADRGTRAGTPGYDAPGALLGHREVPRCGAGGDLRPTSSRRAGFHRASRPSRCCRPQSPPWLMPVLARANSVPGEERLETSAATVTYEAARSGSPGGR